MIAPRFNTLLLLWRSDKYWLWVTHISLRLTERSQFSLSHKLLRHWSCELKRWETQQNRDSVVFYQRAWRQDTWDLIPLRIHWTSKERQTFAIFYHLIQNIFVLVFIRCFVFWPTDELKSHIHSHFSSVIALQGNICIYNCFMLSC